MFKRVLSRRLVILIVGILATGALVILAASLKSFEFDVPGTLTLQFPRAGRAMVMVSAEQQLDWLQNLTMFILALLCASLIAALFDPRMRQWLLRRLPYLVAILLLLLVFSQMRQLNMAPEPPLTAQPEDSGTGNALTEETYIPPQISLLGAFATALVVLLIIAGVGYYVWLKRSVRAPRADRTLEALGGIAQRALNDLDAGRNWEDAIVQCYVRMSETVNLERGLQRHQAMTPSEFAGQLIRAGLPGAAVHRLTQLFEAVRYGARPSTRAEVDEALACLRTIVAACGGVA